MEYYIELGIDGFWYLRDYKTKDYHWSIHDDHMKGVTYEERLQYMIDRRDAELDGIESTAGI